MKAALTAALAGTVGLLVACSGGNGADEAPARDTVEVAADPYERYLELAPPDAPDLTRDDALARAMLGCGTEWPPGTTDAALQEAYAEVIEQVGCESSDGHQS